MINLNLRQKGSSYTLFLIPFIAVLLGSLSCFRYAHVTFSIYFTGGAYNADKDKVIFARYCHAFHRPKGIARFPDGGTVTTRYKSIFLYLLDTKNGSIKKLSEIEKIPPGIPPHIKLAWSGEKITFQMWGSNSVLRVIDEKGNEKKLSSEQEKNKLDETLKAHKEKMLAIKKIMELVKHIKMDEWGVPSPLEYNKKKVKVYIKDLIEKNGDKVYRQEILEKHIAGLSYEERQKIAKKMVGRLEKMKDYILRTYYKFYLYDWDHMLKKILPESEGKMTSEQKNNE